MIGSSQGEVHADMTDSAGDRCATGVNLSRATDQCDQNQTYSGPNRFQSLTGGEKSDSPTDENRRAKIERPADLEIQDRQAIRHRGPVYADERCVGSRQKDLPSRPQNQ